MKYTELLRNYYIYTKEFYIFFDSLKRHQFIILQICC